jgi:heme A synthase
VAFWRSGSQVLKSLGSAAALLVVAQVVLGFLSVYYQLAVTPVSLHTLLAATILTLLAALTTLTWAPHTREAPSPQETPRVAATAGPRGRE